jgi:hypothetical protein
MSRLPASLVRASYLAALLCPVASAPSWAKDLTQLELAHMAQASAVRIGCGVSIGVSNDISAVGPAFMGVFIFSGLVLAGIKLLPKPQGAACWKILRRVSLVYFWTAAITLILSIRFGPMAANSVAALWLVTGLVAVPAALKAMWRLIDHTARSTFSFIKKGIVRARTLYVRVNGNSVTLTQGLRTETRIVTDNETVAKEATTEAETCLTR